MKKFQDSKTTAKGEDRAWVTLNSLDTLWFNTGTRCNLSCENCYIESNPTNDRLSYLTREDVEAYLQEIKTLKLSTRNISFTGGEPFINPHMIQILDLCLSVEVWIRLRKSVCFRKNKIQSILIMRIMRYFAMFAE